MQRERGWRRWQLEKRKRKWRMLMRNMWWSSELDEDPKYIGMLVTTPHPCSCAWCGHKRYWRGPPPQEIRQIPLEIE